MERIATSFCSFERLVKRYTYVDKTDMLWRLVSDSEDGLFFISRPRRFGKSHSGDIRFMMMTGVTKLTKLSVFSGLNNPEDLTMDHPEYAALLGYTPKEIEATYPKRLDALAKKLKTDRKGALKRLLDWYDSYRFCPGSNVRVCNPISIAKSLATRTIRNYWAKTASASLVMERIEAARKTPADFEGCESTVDELDVCDALTLPAKALMYQSGYLTIKKVIGAANGKRGDPADSREGLRRRVQGRQASGHPRRNQLPLGEAQYRRAALRLRVRSSKRVKRPHMPPSLIK